MYSQFKFIALISLLLLFLPQVQAQIDKIEVSYLGAYITQPGLKVNVSKSFHGKTSLNKRGNTIKNEWSWGASLGSYFHRRNHTSIQLLPNIAYLHTRGSGLQLGASLGAGYRRTLIPNSYHLLENGEVSGKALVGQSFFSINPALQIGKQMKDLGLGWFVRPQLLLSTPYFEGLHTHFLLELGISYSLSKK